MPKSNNSNNKASKIVQQAIKEMTPVVNPVPTTKGANPDPTPLTVIKPKKGPFLI